MRYFVHIFAFILMGMCLIGCGPDESLRYDQPMTYAEATNKPDIGFPFPPSSRNIYYGEYQDWQCYTLLVRFQAPVSDCISQIDTVIACDNRIINRTSTYPRITVTNVPFQGSGDFDSVPWFTPNTITHGIYVGTNIDHGPQIWIDTDKGIFYFMQE